MPFLSFPLFPHLHLSLLSLWAYLSLPIFVLSFSFVFSPLGARSGRARPQRLDVSPESMKAPPNDRCPRRLFQVESSVRKFRPPLST